MSREVILSIGKTSFANFLFCLFLTSLLHPCPSCICRAYVSGFEAANSLMKSTSEEIFNSHQVLPVREDEWQFKVGSEVNRKVMKYLPRFWTR